MLSIWTRLKFCRLLKSLTTMCSYDKSIFIDKTERRKEGFKILDFRPVLFRPESLTKNAIRDNLVTCQ